MELDKTTVITGAQSAKPRVGVSQKQLLNLASSNYLGLCSSEQIRDKAIETLRNYGVGSCGPPGFYGTIDVHMDLEKNLAAFIGVEEAIIYAQAFSTISSVIPAFAKRGDMIVVYVSGRIIYLFILLSTPKPLLLFFFFSRLLIAFAFLHSCSALATTVSTLLFKRAFSYLVPMSAGSNTTISMTSNAYWKISASKTLLYV